MDIDKINAALKVRDEKLASAHAKHTKKVVELNDEFAKQQQALAAGFAAEEQKSVEAANAEIDSGRPCRRGNEGPEPVPHQD
jgi:hypothetical protein